MIEAIDFFKADSRHAIELQNFIRKNSNRLDLVREPDFFDALQVEGTKVDIMAAHKSGKIVALGLRSEKPCYLSNAPGSQMMGYISSIKIASGLRSTSVLFHGYRFFRKLHRNGSCRFYLMTIMDDNKKVLKTFQTSAGLSLLPVDLKSIPSILSLGRYFTYILKPSDNKIIREVPSGLTLCRATGRDLPDILAFIRKQGRCRQFFPVYTETDLSGRGLLKNLEPENIFLARMNDRLVGTLAVWDQSAFRKWHINEPEKLFKAFRPPPESGSPDNPSLDSSRLLALVCIENNRQDIFTALLHKIKNTVSGNSDPHLWLGLHENDPLGVIADSDSLCKMTSHLFLVYWPEDKIDVETIQRLTPYLELGSL